jgi:hypothetical protein
MHCHRPLKFTLCADALDISVVADSAMAVSTAFMALLLGNSTIPIS